MDTVALRRKVGLSSQESKYRFERALVELQVDMKILPIGVAQAGAWNYAFIYDLVPRHLPDLLEEARVIKQSEARLELTRLYFRSVGISSLGQYGRIFGWPKRQQQQAIEQAETAGWIRSGISIRGSGDEFFVFSELLGP